MNRVKGPKWFWFAAVGLCMVPLLIAGFKIKNWFWVSLGAVQLMWVFIMPADEESRLFGFFSIGLIIYVFAVVRKDYLVEMEIMNAESVRPTPNSVVLTHNTSNGIAVESSCSGCGATNNNTTEICDYCGKAMTD